MKTITKIARTEADLQKVLSLRKQVFVIEEGRFNNFQGTLSDQYDSGPETNNLLVLGEDNVAMGTMRLNTGPVRELPVSDFINPAILPKSGKVSCTSFLAIPRVYRRRHGVMLDLIVLSSQIWKSQDVRWVASAVRQETAPMWDRIGFQRLGPDRYVDRVDDFITPMIIPLTDLLNWPPLGRRLGDRR